MKEVIRAAKTTASKVTVPPKPCVVAGVIFEPKPAREFYTCVTVIPASTEPIIVSVEVEHLPYDRLTEMTARGWAEAVQKLRGEEAKPSNQGVK